MCNTCSYHVFVTLSFEWLVNISLQKQCDWVTVVIIVMQYMFFPYTLK